ncbi:MAG: bifunctional nuclease family protein, partial [Planctomycetota bacterium]
MDVPMELSRVLITELGDQQVIFLKEKGGERSFPIVIGIAEALAIDRRLKGVPMPRPMTHDLMANVIESLGGTVERVVIHDLQ